MPEGSSLRERFTKLREAGHSIENVRRILITQRWPREEVEALIAEEAPQHGSESPDCVEEREDGAAPLGEGGVTEDDGTSEEDLSAEPATSEQPSGEGLPPARTLLVRAWRTYMSAWWQLLTIAIAPYLLGALGIAVLLGLGYLHELGILGAITTLVIMVVMALAFFLVVMPWSVLAMIAALRRRERGTLTVRDAFRETFTLIHSYWWVMILTGLILLISFLLFAIPGIIMSVWLSFVLYIFVLEHSRGIDVLVVSRELVRGQWWAILWRWAYFALVVLAIFFVTGALLVLFLVVEPGYAETAQRVLSHALNIALTPLASAYGYVFYQSVRERRGMPDVAASGSTRTLFIWLIAAAAIGIAGALVLALQNGGITEFVQLLAK